MEKVYITGRGLVTPLGDTLSVNEAALRAGKSGIVSIPEFIEHKLDSTVGGKPNFCPQTNLLDRKSLRFCPPVGVMSVAAAEEAFLEAGIAIPDIPNYRIAIISGVAGGNYLELFDTSTAYVTSDYRLRAVTPFAVPRIMPSSAVSNLSIVFGITGETYDVSAACASSALAVIVGSRLIRSGEYDMVLAGGAEQLDWVEALGFCACRALSRKYNDCPEKASRPFDKGRDGFVFAGGAAYVLLESERSIKVRNGKPIVEISGFAANSNAKDMVVPDATATANVMRQAILNAKLTGADIDYVNTHGTGTPVGDPIELAAVKEIMGTNVAINSTKSQTGHMVGATGAAEIIFTSIMMEKGFISPNVNLEDPDDEFSWADLVRETRTGVEIKHALSNSFAFGGSNAAVVLSKI